jgi:hypothetical protein
VCLSTHTHTHTDIYIYIYIYQQWDLDFVFLESVFLYFWHIFISLPTSSVRMDVVLLEYLCSFYPILHLCVHSEHK